MQGRPGALAIAAGTIVFAGAGIACSQATAPTATPTPTTSAATVAPTSTNDETAVAASGEAAVSFGDLDLAGSVTDCVFDPELEAPEDGSPLTVLTVLSTASGPEGNAWSLQFVRTLAGPSIIDSIHVHLDDSPMVDRYEAQRVVDTDAQDVTDHWGESTNALLVPVINNGRLMLTPPDEVTFGVFPAETDEDPHVAGVGTFEVTCTLS